MNYSNPPLLLVALLLLASSYTSAQERSGKPGAATPAASEADEAVWHARRLAAEAQRVEPLGERIRLLAVTGDLLWKKDAVYARQLLLKASETLREAEGSDDVSVPDPARLRETIVGVALKHDPELSRQLLREAERPAADGRGESSRPRDPEELSKLLLRSAASAFGTDERQALDLYEQSVAQRVLPEHCYALFKIQEKSPEAADRFFARALTALARRPPYEANELMYFASYLFSREKSIRYSLVQRYNAANVNGGLTGAPRDPALARQFLTLVHARLNAGPTIPPSLVYFALHNLAPHFQTYAPALAPQVNAKMAAMLQDVPRDELESNRQNTVPAASRPEAKAEGWEQRVRDAEKIPDAGRRDLEYYMALQEAYLPKKDYAGAYRVIDLVGDRDLRRRLSDYVDFAVAQEEAQKADFALVRPAVDKLQSPLLKTLLLCNLVPALAGRRQAADAAEALRLADAASLGIKDDQERAQMRMLVAQAYLKVEPAVSFEMTRALLREAEKDETLDLKKSRVQYTIGVFGLKSELPTPFSPVNLFSLMGRLGRENLHETLLLCDQLKNNDRLWASLAAIRHALEAEAPAAAGPRE